MTAAPTGVVTPPVLPEGILVVDKPAGMTSHDVVARARRALGTRKVGHAGTLDPMATGVLVLGVGRATRMLGHIAGHDKAYEATILLGASTVTDDAEGEVIAAPGVHGVSDAQIDAGIAALRGSIQQTPSAVSAVKVDGRRAYARVREGEDVQLPARAVTVTDFSCTARRRTDDRVELDVHVECSTGTYVRALARDLGSALGCGGHLTRLRRTRVGRFTLADSCAIDAMSADACLSLTDAACRAFPTLTLTEQEADDAVHGRAVPWHGGDDDVVHALLAPDGRLIALGQRGDMRTRLLAVLGSAPS